MHGGRVFSWDRLTLVLHGAHLPVGELEAFAANLRAYYLEEGELGLTDRDGAISLALFDAVTGRTLLYRSLGGPVLYYRADTAFRCDSILSRLAEQDGEASLCRDALPAFFLFGRTLGRDTLFDGCRRLLPGEEVLWDGRQVRVRQRRRLSDLVGAPGRTDALADTLCRVLADLTTAHPQAVTLLDGSAASVCVEALRTDRGTNDLPTTAGLAIDRPVAWAATDAGVRAAHVLGARQRLISADATRPVCLLDAVSGGETPTDLRDVYRAALFLDLRQAGYSSVLLTDGAEAFAATPNRGWLPRLLAWWPLGRECSVAAGRRLITEEMFGRPAVADALGQRRGMRERLAGPGASAHMLRIAEILLDRDTESGVAGCAVLSPFLDARMLRLAVNRRSSDEPLADLARRLAPTAPCVAAPDFAADLPSWLAPSGALGPLVADIDRHYFLDADVLDRLREQPSELLFTLLTFDVWHKRFLNRHGQAYPDAMPKQLTADATARRR
jgi:hypothetical protein